MLGSCNKVDKPNPFWAVALQNVPDAWIWMGDSVYADIKRPLYSLPWNYYKAHQSPMGVETTMFEPTSMERLKGMYDKQRDVPGYKELREQTRILGTYDDHDYGHNDADARFVDKAESKRLFWDFLGESASSPLRTQQGVWSNHTFSAGNGKTVMVIMLDGRYHKTAYPTWPVRLRSFDPASDFLGEEQWEWLLDTLAGSDADAHLIVSGIQIIPELRWMGENWSRFPLARQRLLNTLLSSGAKEIVLASGDVHFGEISVAKCRRGNEERQLIELTTSGLTHAWSTGPRGVEILDWTMWALPFRYQTGSAVLPSITPHLNAGEIAWSWPTGGGDGEATLNILDKAGAPLFTHRVPLSRPAQEERSGGGGGTHWDCAPGGRDSEKGAPTQMEVLLANLLLLSPLFLLPLLAFLPPLLLWNARRLVRRLTLARRAAKPRDKAL